MNVRSRLPGLAVFAWLLVGCVAGAPASAPPSTLRSGPPPAAVPNPTLNPNQVAEQHRSTSPSALPIPSAAPSLAPTPSAPAQPSASPYAADLEALLPAELRGVPLTRYSFPSSAICEGCDFCSAVCAGELPGLAKALGVDVSRIDVAIAVSDAKVADPPKVLIVAMRVRGAATNRLVQARLDSYRAGSFSAQSETVTVKGRAVTWAIYGFPTAGTMEYLYAHDDVLFRIVDGVERTPGSPTTPPDTVLAIEALP